MHYFVQFYFNFIIRAKKSTLRCAISSSIMHGEIDVVWLARQTLSSKQLDVSWPKATKKTGGIDHKLDK